MNRRDVLRGVASVPLLTAVNKPGFCSGIAATPPVHHPAEPQCDGGDGASVSSPALNVLFHGPFVFVVYPDRIEAITPRVAAHVYGAGNWYDEYAIAEGAYSLSLPQGTPAAKKVIALPSNALKVPMQRIQDIDPDSESYCTVILPMPDRAGVLGTFRRDMGTMFRGQDLDLVKGMTELGTVHAFTYQLSSDKGKLPELPDTGWDPNMNELGAYNLHVFSSPTFQFRDEQTAAQHASSTFDAIVALLPGLRLHLRSGPQQVDYQPPSPYAGVFGKEQGRLRGCTVLTRFHPPVLCDVASVFVTGAS